MKRIANGTRVVITDDQSRDYGNFGVVMSWSKPNKHHENHQVGLLMENPDGSLKASQTWFDARFVTDGSKLLTWQYNNIKTRRAELEIEWANSERAWYEKRRREALAEYVNTRRLDLDRLALERRDRTRADDPEGSLRVEWAEPHRASDLVSINCEPTGGRFGSGLPRVEINWAAIGSCSVERALEFHRALGCAIAEAEAQRHTIESNQSDLADALLTMHSTQMNALLTATFGEAPSNA